VVGRACGITGQARREVAMRSALDAKFLGIQVAFDAVQRLAADDPFVSSFPSPRSALARSLRRPDAPIPV
jgi:hypothetical protein